MLKYLKGLIVVGIIVTLVSCDPEYCSYHSVINNSGQKLALFSYRSGKVDTLLSFSLVNGASREFVAICAKGDKGVPGLPFSSDSVLIFFNDTVRGVLFKNPHSEFGAIYGEKNFVIYPDAWIEVKRYGDSYYYEYQFTDWHYQKALEANGFAVD